MFTSKNSLKILSFNLLFSFWALAANAPQNVAGFLTHQQQLKMGKELYARHCASCHGIDAMGRGAASAMLNPKPRNFMEGVIKFKSTSYGTPPTRADFLRIMERGLKGSSMPSFNFLPSRQREAIADYLLSLREDWSAPGANPISIPYPPAELRNKETFLASALRGQKHYMELCMSCHGEKGLGDGPASAELYDGEENLIKPGNLRHKYLKSGTGSRDVYRVMSAGIEGTPMPPFEEVLKDKDRWDVVAFVLFLRGQEEGLYPADMTLEEAARK